MNDEITNIPKIRFRGYTEDWEQRKAKEIFIPKVDKNQPELPVLSVTQESGVVYRDQLGIDIKYDKTTLKNYKVVQQGDFIISLRSFQGGFELSDKLGITSPAYTIFVPQKINNQDSLFWKIKFKTFTFIESLKTVTFGIRDGKSISFSEFGDLKLLFPKNIEEQREIGTFFKQLDDTIALHQRELDLLRKTKQTYLQKMFPKTGEDRPEIRFAGFTEPWEQRKLGDESDVRDGTHDSPEYYDKGYPLVTSKNLKDFGLDLSNVSFISDEDFEVINKRSKVGIGDILFGMIGTIGNPVLVDRADFAIKNVALIKEQKKILNSFLIQILKSPVFDKYIKNENAGGTQKFLSLSKIRDFNFLCPNIEEQNCISAFFKQLDDTIALHQRNLNVLKEMKKSLLQQMFV